MKIKHKNKFRVTCVGAIPNYPIFEFRAPNADAAKFYTEMCGFEVVSVVDVTNED